MPPTTDLPQDVDWSFVQKRKTCHLDSVVGESRWPDINSRATVIMSDDHIQPATSKVRRCRHMLFQPKLIQYVALVPAFVTSRIDHCCSLLVVFPLRYWARLGWVLRSAERSSC